MATFCFVSTGWIFEFSHSPWALHKLTPNQDQTHAAQHVHTAQSLVEIDGHLPHLPNQVGAEWQDRQDTEVTEPQEWSDSFLAMAKVSQAEVAVVWELKSKAHRLHAHEPTTWPGSTSWSAVPGAVSHLAWPRRAPTHPSVGGPRSLGSTGGFFPS